MVPAPLPPAVQLSALASLRHLSLSGTEYMPPSGYDVLTSLTNLSSLSLTRSRVWPTALRHLTALRRLDLESCGAWSHWAIVAAGPGQAMQQTLQALPYLTTLCLRGSLPRLPAPGQALTEGLQLLVDQSAAVMPAHWPDSLRAAGTSWEQLLAQPLQLGAAPQLRHLAIRPYHSYLWGAAAQQPGWAALWAWLEHAPQLRLLEVRWRCASPASQPACLPAWAPAAYQQPRPHTSCTPGRSADPLLLPALGAAHGSVDRPRGPQAPPPGAARGRPWHLGRPALPRYRCLLLQPRPGMTSHSRRWAAPIHSSCAA